MIRIKNFFFLYPLHREKRIRNFLKDCKECSQKGKEKRWCKYRKELKRFGRKAQRLRKNSTPATATSMFEFSILFTAVIGSKFRDINCADNGAEANIIGNETFRRITAAGVDFEVESHSKPRKLDMASANVNGKNAMLVCKGFCSIAKKLHIKKGSTLRICKLKLLVTEQRVANPFLRRPILEALRPNTRDLLAAAADQIGGSVGAKRLIGSSSDAVDGARVTSNGRRVPC